MIKTDLFIRQNKINILRYLPKFLAESEVFKATADINSDEHEKRRLLLVELLKQKYVRYATDGVIDWEKEFDINSNGDNLEDRKARILLYLKANNISTKAFCEKIASIYCTYPATIVEDIENYSFEIRLKKDSCFNFDNLISDIELYKPAHLGYTLHEIERVNGLVQFATTVREVSNIRVMPAIDYNIEPIKTDVKIGSYCRLTENIKLKNRGGI